MRARIAAAKFLLAVLGVLQGGCASSQDLGEEGLAVEGAVDPLDRDSILNNLLSAVNDLTKMSQQQYQDLAKTQKEIVHALGGNTTVIEDELHECRQRLHKEVDQYQSTLFFDSLLEQLKEEDPTAFTNAASQIREPNSPTLQDLTDMYNEIDKGIFPKYMRENNYTLIANGSAWYNNSNGNVGTTNYVLYGTLRSDGYVGTYSSLEFMFNEGKFGIFHYKAGTSFYIHTRYTKGKSFLNFQSSVLASILTKRPMHHSYTSHGNFTGIAQSNAVSDPEGVTTDISVNTLGILHISEYYSKNVINLNQRSNNSGFSSYMNEYSLTGGTNATLNILGNYFPAEDANNNTTVSGTLKNPGNEVTMFGAGRFLAKLEPNDPFSDTNICNLFVLPRSGADVYLYP